MVSDDTVGQTFGQRPAALTVSHQPAFDQFSRAGGRMIGFRAGSVNAFLDGIGDLAEVMQIADDESKGRSIESCSERSGQFGDFRKMRFQRLPLLRRLIRKAVCV